MKIPGIHHVTAIAGPAQQNADFYTGFLGLRLVKKTINFDDPGAYHLYYGDALGHPGTILTFFPWAHAAPGRAGAGMTGATAYSIAESALDTWMERLADAALDFETPAERFGTPVLRFRDPDGLPLELAADADGTGTELRSFHSVTFLLHDPAPTARLLTQLFGYDDLGQEDGRHRFQAPGDGPARLVDLVQADERGRPGAGTVHHVAFRARDDAEQRVWQDRVATFGLHVTEVKDRNYFRSIYFREPGGVLFEIATDGPGFTADEPAETLGTALKLPAWLESRRPQIEAQLPPLTLSPKTTPAP